ncbi:hypothetical protein CERZMDRAFT_80527 [Cercospora zeae-maydis SCOH1-5]|uniref:DUF6604 domain-containing protein n=1 Tax=Cercospora zeae-maydis SCOH1-5 TaxID=717836 RepID=A0A6A6FWV7_9PEZI|nr:hypothetical protein CERZMDRAFT_80527 [Cercospora zeae-maydis SCOH1-5]
MASIPLVSHYLRYKAGTARLVNWLASSAQQLDDRRARASGATPDSTIPKNVSLSTLIEYAKRVVAARNPTIEISTAILAITKDAILGRTASMQWYQEIADNGNSAGVKDVSDLRQANSTHKHFLQVLEQVWEILNREHKSRRPKRKKQMPKLASVENDLTNLYQHLQIEEPADIPGGESASDELSDPVTSAAPPNTQAGQGADEFQLDNGREDELFAIWCVLKDMFDIRVHLKGAWRQYKQGTLSFISAAKIAASGMAVCWEIAGEFRSMHPDLDDFDKVIAVVGAQDFNLIATDAQIYYGDEEHDETCTGCHDRRHFAELLCCHAWRALESFRNVQQYVWANECERRDVFQGRKPYINIPGFPFTKVLMNLAFELKKTFPCIGPRHFDQTAFAHASATTDLYLTELLVFSANDKMDIELVAATQIYADMHDELSDNMSCALKESERAHHFVMGTVQQYGSGLGDTFWSKALENAPLQVKQEQNGARGWIIRIPEGAREDLISAETFIPESILRALPLLPANIVRCHLYAAQQQAIEKLSKYGLLLSAAHLYHAGRMIRAIPTPWDDMDFVIERQETRGVSLRIGATTPRSTARHFLLAIGHSLAEVTNKKLPDMLTPVQAESKRVKCVSACLFDLIRCKEVHTGELHLLYQVVKAHGKRIQDQTIKTQYLATKRLNPTQLLQVAQEVLVDDEPHLYFDYLNFSHICKTFVVDASRIAAEGLWIEIILWRAARDDERQRSKSATELWKVGKVANKLITAHGSKYKTQALDIISSRIDQDEASNEPPSPAPPGALNPDEHVSGVDDIDGLLQYWHDHRHYPVEAEVLRAAHDSFTFLTAEQGATPTDAVKKIQIELDEQYLQKMIGKQPIAELSDGQLVLNTKPLTEGWFERRAGQSPPRDLEEIMAKAPRLQGFTLI